RLKNLRLLFDELSLLLGRELDHAPGFVRAERGEDFAADAKIGMAHVRAFNGFGKVESKLAKHAGSHWSLFGNQVLARIARIEATASQTIASASHSRMAVETISPKKLNTEM